MPLVEPIRRVIRGMVGLLTFADMPIRRKFGLFSLGVSFWFCLIGVVGLSETGWHERAFGVLAAILAAHALLLLFTISITRALIQPISEMTLQVERVARDDLDALEQVGVASEDELGQLSNGFNGLLGAIREVHGFRKTIEEDISQAEVLTRLSEVFEAKGLPVHRAYTKTRDRTALRLVCSAGEGPTCGPSVLADERLCRAFRTGRAVCSTNVPRLCGQLEDPTARHICVPAMVNGSPWAVFQFLPAPDLSERVIAERLAVAGRFVREAVPIMQSLELTETLRDLALRDSLTGLYNRRYIEESHGALTAAAHRRGAVLTLLLCDIDRFKGINDRLGHNIGDRIIRLVGERIKGAVREADLVIRLGGDEFLAVLLDAEGEGPMLTADRVRREVQRADGVGPWGTVGLTISVGVAQFPTDSQTFWECVALADQALYRAKAEGRDRAVRWSAAVCVEPPASSGRGGAGPSREPAPEVQLGPRARCASPPPPADLAFSGPGSRSSRSLGRSRSYPPAPGG